MLSMIAPVDYALVNLKSIRDMLGRADIDGVISIEPDEAGAASKLIFLGIEHFLFRMRPPQERGLVEMLNDRVPAAPVPIAGAQLRSRERSTATPPASSGYETCSPRQSIGS